MAVQFLIVDDDFGPRKGLAQTLGDFYPEAELLQASSVAAAIAVLTEQPNLTLVLLDLNVEDSRGMQTLRTLKDWCEAHDCNPRIVILSAAADYDESVIAEAIDGCATGFIAKGSSEEVFRSAIELTLAGAIYIPERYLRARRRPGHSNDDPAFTPRERQIAGLLIQGLTYKQIAKRLSEPGKPLSDHTVRVHVQRMAWKLRVTDDPEKDNLAAKAAVLTAFADKRLHFHQ
jgi:DNA-binding NarL/FixJ family response regulator